MYFKWTGPGENKSHPALGFVESDINARQVVFVVSKKEPVYQMPLGWRVFRPRRPEL